MPRLAAVVCSAVLVLFALAHSLSAQDAPLPEDAATLNRLATNHEKLAVYVDALPDDRQLVLAPAIAKNPNPDMRYIAASIYIRHKKTDAAIDTVVDFAVSSDLAERYLTGLGWSMVHGADEDGTIKTVIEGLMARTTGDLNEFTPDQRARLHKLLGRAE